VHMACINPNPKYLMALLQVDPCIDLEDDDMWQPIHYAAACEGSEPLQCLLRNGADPYAQTSNGSTPLHIAAKYGRIHNIAILLRGHLSPETIEYVK